MSDKAQQYELTLKYRIKYETEVPIPLKDIIKALESLEGLLQNTSTVLEDLSQVEVQGHKIYVQRIEAGSLVEDILVKIIFGDKQKLDDFTTWLHNTNMKNILIGALIGGALTYGFTVLTNNNAVPGSNSGSQIVNSPNSMIVNFPSGALSDVAAEQINLSIAKHIQNKNEYAKQTLNFLEPTKNDPKASISLGEGTNAKANIPASSIKDIPRKYTPKKNNRFEDLNGIVIKLRATDLDSKKSGWAGSIDGITDRLKVELDPTLDPIELYGKKTITADVTLERDFNPKENKLVPKRIIIRAIY